MGFRICCCSQSLANKHTEQQFASVGIFKTEVLWHEQISKTQPQNRAGAANMAAVARMSNSRTVFRRGPMYLPWNKYSASRVFVR